MSKCPRCHVSRSNSKDKEKEEEKKINRNENGGRTGGQERERR